jgi:hypothetical protein
MIRTTAHWRAAPAACALALCSIAAQLVPAHALAGAVEPGGAEALLLHCVTSGEPATRSATFSAQMTALPGTHRMAMRVEVQERIDGAALFRTVVAPGFGTWRTSGAGVNVYKYLDEVTNLAQAGAYRAVVHFRWLNARGRVIGRAVRRTPVCHEPAPSAGEHGAGQHGTAASM